MSDAAELPQVKIVCRFPSRHGTSVETLWADDLGDGTYRMDNLPYFSDDFSYNDVVAVRFEPDEPRPIFDRVVRSGGFCTIRVLLLDHTADEAERDRLVQALQAAADVKENASRRLFVLCVKPERVAPEFYEPLMFGVSRGHWEWSTGYSPTPLEPSYVRSGNFYDAVY